jgi:hypothetical protein
MAHVLCVEELIVLDLMIVKAAGLGFVLGVELGMVLSW